MLDFCGWQNVGFYETTDDIGEWMEGDFFGGSMFHGDRWIAGQFILLGCILVGRDLKRYRQCTITKIYIARMVGSNGLEK